MDNQEKKIFNDLILKLLINLWTGYKNIIKQESINHHFNISINIMSKH